MEHWKLSGLRREFGGQSRVGVESLRRSGHHPFGAGADKIMAIDLLHIGSVDPVQIC